MKKLLLKIIAYKKRRSQFNPKTFKSVLIRPIGNAVGDAVTLTAILRQIKTAFPKTKTGVFVTERNIQVLENCPFADVLIPLTPLSYLKNRKKWDVFLDCTPTFTTKNILLDYILAPRYNICFSKQDKKIYNKNSVKNYDFYADVPNTAHITELLNFTPFAPFVKSINSKYFVEEDLPTLSKMQKLWPANRIKILLAPRGSNKMINKKDLEGIVLALKKKYQDKLAFLMLNAKDSYFLEGVEISPKLNLKEYFMLIKSADIVIAVDSANVHLANAFNIPVTAVYANSPAATLWAPLPGTESFVIMPEVRQNSNTVIDGFDIKSVISATERFINKRLLGL